MSNYLKTGLEVIAAEIAALQGVSARLGHEFSDAVEVLLGCKTKVVVAGLGKSGHIARKIASTFCSTGMPAVFLHASEAGHGDLGIYSPGDPVIVISKSASTSELVHLAPVLRQKGSKLIGILGRPKGPLADASDIILDISVPREADPLGIVPTSSTVATLAMGDALAGALMQARGITENDFAKNHPAGQLGRNLLLTVGDVMHPLQNTAVVRQDASLKEVVIAMTQHPLGAALVMNGKDQLRGIITDGDLRRALAGVEDIRELNAERLMTTDPICIQPAALLHEAVQMMEDRSSQIAVLPVSEGSAGIPIGLLRLHDAYQPGQR
jgi:arabinose-5-phosphate isomerase